MYKFNSRDFYEKLDFHFNNSNRDQIEGFLKDSFFTVKTILDRKALVTVGNEYASFLRLIGNTEESYKIYEEIRPLIIEIFGEKSKEYASFLLNLGDVDIVAGDYKKALNNFNIAEHILNKFVEERYLLATLYNNRSSALRNLGENKLAIKDIKKALHIVSNMPLKTAISLINLCEIYILEGEFNKAKDKICEAIMIFKNSNLKNDIHYANALSTAGQIYYYLGDYEKSHAYYLCSLDRFIKKAGDSKVTEIIKSNIKRVERLKNM